MAASAACGGATGLAAPSEIRTWTSQAGSTFVGHLERFNPNEVVLQGADGRRVTLKPAELSAVDQQYLHESQLRQHEERLTFFRSGVFDGSGLPEKAEIRGVRHVLQRENFCVPASAEMALRFHGFTYDQDDIAELTSKDSAKSGGTNFSDLQQALRNLRIDSVILPYAYDRPAMLGNLMNGIRTAIDQGYPALMAYRTPTNAHAVAVVGYDDRRKAFWVMDPGSPRSKPERLDYRELEDILINALVPLPPPRSGGGGVPDPSEHRETLRTISAVLKGTAPDALQTLPARFHELQMRAEYRDVNRGDLRNQQGQTRLFARRDGVEIIRRTLESGFVVVAPQNYEAAPAEVILIYGIQGNEFETIQYGSDGELQQVRMRPLDFSLRWLSRPDARTYSLPIVEIDLASAR